MAPSNPAVAWYRAPVLWLGAAIFVAALAGCVTMIVLAARHPDPALASGAPHILKVPVARAPHGDPAPASR